MESSPSLIAHTLREGRCVSDSGFDRIYPAHVRAVSCRFWTPVSVALTGAQWLHTAGCQNLLDVGAGAGKFCIVASLVSGRASVGLEQREQLIATARLAARTYAAPACFELGTIDQFDPCRFDAWYFYNPFGENDYSGAERFDETVELSETRAARDVATVESWLDRAAVGTCVLTYHGFGGRMPDTYALERRLRLRGGELRLWVKRRAGRSRGFVLDAGDSIFSCEQLEDLASRSSGPRTARMHAVLARSFT